MSMLPSWVAAGLDLLATLFVVAVGFGVLAVASMFVADVRQSEDAIRRNYPVVGRFRELFSTLGEFFRQYFFAMDREELPFNRAERGWANRSANGRDNTIAFGSTRLLTVPGTPIFVNCPFPPLDSDYAATEPLTFGPSADIPYAAPSLVNISGMSYGAISKPAVMALARGAAKAGCWLNTGEGGLSPYHLDGGADIVFQIGTAKYGVRTPEGQLSDEKLHKVAGHASVRMFEIKLSQGAKPGKGGILPAAKVNAEIALIRGIPEGADSLSPNRHPEVDTIDELLDFIGHVRAVTGKPTGFKAVMSSEAWLDDLCTAIHRRGVDTAPDFITVDGGDGGTGAAPMPLMDCVGLPLREALPMTADALMRHGLKDRIRLIASGKLVTPSGAAWALAAGADVVTTARGFMFALGCIQALKCNQNTCPTGITTHVKRLQSGLDPADKANRVANYAKTLVKEIETIAHSCGVREPRRLKRHHVRIVQDDGRSTPLNRIYPVPEAGVATAAE